MESIRFKRRFPYVLITVVLLVAIMMVVPVFRMSTPPQAKGTGMASNPIIWADVPDPSVIRVGEEYYMSSTTMHMMPGTPIMRSTDLVNWEIIGYPYERLEENDTYALRNGQNAYGQGSWASSLNYHDGVFYVLFSALDTGKTYLFSTTDPAGRWKRVEFPMYMHDPSLLFDDDGRAYIIHGRTDLSVTELSEDYKSLKPNGLNQTIITSGKEGMEGAHAYKINGRYYITTIWWEEGNIRRQYVYRADRIEGPYEERLVLSDTMGYKNHGVAQGGLVDTPDGDWYAMLFQDHDAVGRVPVLVPVRWEDGWPVYGDEEGKVPLEFEKPGVSEFETELVRSDEFYQEGVIEEDEQDIEDEGVELTKNPHFDEGTAHWKARGSEISVIEENGNSIAHVSNREHTWAGIEQSFSWRLQPGKSYKAAFRVRYTEGPESKDFILTAQKVINGQTSYQNLVRGQVNKGQWQVIQGTFTIPEEVSSIDLFLETPWVENPDPEQDLMDFYVDYISVKESGSASPNPEAAPNGSKLGLTWQWNHNPDNSKWSLTERKGYLRLRTANIAENLEQARNTLTQRTQGPYSSGWIALDTSHMLDGDYAGLAAFQQEYGFIGVTKENGTSYIIMELRDGEQARTELLQERVYLKIDMDFTVDRATFYYSYDGVEWTPFGTELEMRYTIPHFMGYRFAIFNYATKQLGGYVDVDYFKFAPELTGLQTPEDLRVYLGVDTVIVSEDANIHYDVPVLINRFPQTEPVYEIRFDITVPDALEVVEVLPNQDQLGPVNVNLSPVDDGLEVSITPGDGEEAIYDDNQNLGNRLAIIRLKIKEDMEYEETDLGEVQLRTMNVYHQDQNKKSYDVSSANAKVSMVQPAPAIGKVPPHGNPLVSHKFGADPYALVYNGRVYLYMTNDVFEYDAEGNVKENSYALINKIGVISSDDLVNWTDHGEIHVAGPNGAAKWATQSWAPAIAHKVIDGQDRFFLYFANNASHIGVLTSDSPLGPWVDPLGKPLIDRSTPGVEGVHWLFDPAVLVDDDGTGYIYFGGGVPNDQYERPLTSRVMQLGDDMISVVGEAVTIDAPFMFEDNGIHKYNGVYYYTYCSNFYSGPRPEGSPGAGEIVYMKSNHPMGPWEYGGTILKNPMHFFGVGGNNHHAIFSFNDEWYIAYHAQTLAHAMGEAKGYRSTHLNRVYMNEDGSIQEIEANYEGVAQLKALDPFQRVEAETFAWNAGVKTRAMDEGDPVNRVLTDIQSGDWIALSQVDFGDGGATTFTAAIANVKADGFIELRLDRVDGERIGTLPISLADAGTGWTELSTTISSVQGVHDLYLVFAGPQGIDLFEMDYWKLSR